MAPRATPTPQLDPDIARLAGVLADRSRVAMLEALLDGSAHTIGALARRAGVTAATASGHLRRLIDEQLVVAPHHGRERRVRLASADVARLLETLACLTLPAPAPVTTTAAATRARELRFARLCYDHLAGGVGVRLTGALIDRGWLRTDDDSFAVTPPLVAWLADRGHPLVEDPRSRRPLARACLDWSERTPHLAGRIGAAIADLALAEQWLVRVRGSRALRLTARGRAALAADLAVTFA